MPKVNPSEGSEKWARRTKAAVPDVKAGIARVRESPTAKAAQKLDKLLANLTEAINSGKMAAALESVSLEEWKRLADGGTARIAQGIDAKGLAKMQEFAREFYPFLESLQGQIASMPDTTLEDSIARMTANVRGIHDFGQRRRK